MIFGHISKIGAMPFAAPIMRGLDFLKNTDFSQKNTGRYDIEGNEIFALIFDLETSAKSENSPEVHRNYIDIQYLVSGKEIIGVTTDLGTLPVKTPYDEKRDILFYADSENETDLHLLPGNFAIFFPEDVHRPNCQYENSQKIRKVVVKIALSLL